ncbi:SDR family oxidoreductase [Zafaria sp. Z1313]|uniref:SDR family oxidoreductase n=1 Tax=unclassified Zafaria TaxID=2828765 RepID=UPI002E78D1BE|nr:SDR family oxidoreductase [Zafaria sp. J156]MEE1619936.1 SDR family oxidoreductase [Zafaria sp. J156]
MSRIAVIGGHGKVALHLARLLAGRGDEVTSIVRNPAHAADIEAAGATPLTADVEALDAEGLAALLAGHDAVVWSAGAGGGDADRTYAVDRDAAIRSMDAAAAAGARRYVMVSYLGSSTRHGVPAGDPFFAYAEAKAAADAYLRDTELDWTILGPGRLTLEPGSGRIAIGDAIEQDSVAREDVAAVAAEVLSAPGTIRRTVPFNNGPTPIAEAVAAAGRLPEES